MVLTPFLKMIMQNEIELKIDQKKNQKNIETTLKVQIKKKKLYII